jgi:hypothetical protein
LLIVFAAITFVVFHIVVIVILFKLNIVAALFKWVFDINNAISLVLL